MAAAAEGGSTLSVQVGGKRRRWIRKVMGERVFARRPNRLSRCISPPASPYRLCDVHVSHVNVGQPTVTSPLSAGSHLPSAGEPQRPLRGNTAGGLEDSPFDGSDAETGERGREK